MGARKTPKTRESLQQSDGSAESSRDNLREREQLLRRSLLKSPEPQTGSGKPAAEPASANGERTRVIGRKEALGNHAPPPKASAAPASETKPRPSGPKTPARPLTEKQVDKLRAMLLTERQRVLADAHHLDAELHQSGESADAKSYGAHIAESASLHSALDIARAQSQVEDGILTAIEESLQQLAQGVYGRCARCGESIGYARLSAKPYARYCVDCRELVEKNGGHH